LSLEEARVKIVVTLENDIARLVIEINIVIPWRNEVPRGDDVATPEIGTESQWDHVADTIQAAIDHASVDAVKLANVQPLPMTGRFARKIFQIIEWASSGFQSAAALV